MNAEPRQLIAPVQLAATLTSYYTAPSNKRVIVSRMTLSNPTNSAISVDVHVVPAGETADATNMLLSDKTLDADQSFAVYTLEGQILAPGDEIWAIAGTAASVVLMASGVTVV